MRQNFPACLPLLVSRRLPLWLVEKRKEGTTMTNADTIENSAKTLTPTKKWRPIGRRNTSAKSP